MARILVCGYMIRHPLAGNLLAYFHYLLGLHRLGHEVAYLEESGWPDACYDPATGGVGDDPRSGLRIVEDLLAKQGVAAPVGFVSQETGQVYGADWDGVKRMLREADLLLNVGGVCWLPEFRLCRRRALIDMDPLFTQVGQFGGSLLDEHHVHFSYGGNIGRPGCTIPTLGINWLPTVPPVVLDLWEGPTLREGGTFTTIANWSAYGAVIHQGQRYGQKDKEFLRLIDLPAFTDQPLELVLAGVPNSIGNRMRDAGWSIRDAGEPVGTDFPAYQTYIRGSRGELSVAKHAYVKTHSGWFSDRTVCYLAAGRPVVVQDTGFTDWLHSGNGVFAFSSASEAADCLERVNAAYDAQSRAASETARKVFAHDVVLGKLLNKALDGVAT